MINDNFDTFYFQKKKEINNSEWMKLENKKLKEFELCCFFLWNYNRYIKIEQISEQPDFILNYKWKKIWLEIVEITPIETIRKKEWCQEKLLKKIELFFYKEEKLKNFLAVCYLKDFNFKQNEENTIIEELKLQLTLWYKSFIKSNTPYLNIKNIKSKYIKKISFQKHSKVSIIRWTWTFFSNTLDSNTLLKTIDKKNEKIKKYNKNLDENILLLFIDTSKSSSYQILDNINNISINSEFDKIFLYSRFWDNLILLNHKKNI